MLKAIAFLALLFVVGGQMELSAKPAVEVVAHRGASYLAPENTLASLQLAWQQKTDAVEIDVYLTADKQIVLSHDANTKRCGGVDMDIAKSNAEELQTLDVGKWKGPEFEGEKMPLLLDALKTIPRGKRMFVEIKCGPEIVPYFLDRFRKSHKSHRQVAVISFNAQVIEAVKKEYPKMMAYWLAVPDKTNKLQLLETAKAVSADGLDLGVTDALDHDYVQQIKSEGLGMYVWTVDDPKTGKRLADMGVDGITTNKPAEMLKALGR